MPYTVELSESGGFAVLYFLPEHPGAIEVLWAGNKLDAEMEATRLNEIDRLLRAKLAKRGEISGESKEIDL